jgi:hypothetical protein
MSKKQKFKNIKTGNNRQTVYKDRKPFVHLSFPAADSISHEEVNLELEKRAALIVRRLEENTEQE